MKRTSSNGHITNGILFIHNEKGFRENVAKLKAGDCIITVQSGTRRSIDYNNYHFGVCQYVADKLAERGCEGYTSEDIHYYTVGEVNSILKPMIDIATGEITQKPIPQGTRDMSTSEFMEFRDRFNQFWAEKGINVPDEYWKD